MNKLPSRKQALIYLIIASVLWSTGGLLIKLVDLNPVAIAGSRSFIAALLMLLFLKKTGSKVSFKQSKLMYFGAFAYAMTVILFVSANKMTTAANAILLQYTAPIFVAIFSIKILKQKVSKIDWISIFIVMLGMVLFFVGDLNIGQIGGNLVAILSGVFLALTIIFLKVNKDSEPVMMPFIGNIMTFIIALPFILSSDFTVKSIIGIILLGVFQLGISYILFALAMTNVSPIEGILIPVIEPLLNPIWVLMFTGEMPTIYAIFGGIVVIAGVTLRSILIAREGEK
jgi:drug/metabolite transporter (DMT)-like permease